MLWLAPGFLIQTRVAVDPSGGLVDPDNVRKAIRPETKLHRDHSRSNVTGYHPPIREIGGSRRACDPIHPSDARPSAGHVPIDVAGGFASICSPPRGHMGLLGLRNGIVYIRPGVEKACELFEKAARFRSSELGSQPDFMPEQIRAGKAKTRAGIVRPLGRHQLGCFPKEVGKLAAHERELCALYILTGR